MNILESTFYRGRPGQADFAVALIGRGAQYVVARITEHSLSFDQWINGEYFSDHKMARQKFRKRNNEFNRTNESADALFALPVMPQG